MGLITLAGEGTRNSSQLVGIWTHVMWEPAPKPYLVRYPSTSRSGNFI